MTEPEIRRATTGDLEAVTALMGELRQATADLNPFVKVPDPLTLRKHARGYLEGPCDLVLVGLDQGQAQGFIRANVREGEKKMPLPGRTLPWAETLRRTIARWRRPGPARITLYVADLYVRPGCRRRGIGRKLLAEAEKALAGARPELAYLNAMADNHEGQAFWRSAGFRGENLVMVKRGKPAPEK